MSSPKKLRRWYRKWSKKVRLIINSFLSIFSFVINPSSSPVWTGADRAFLKKEEELRISLANKYNDSRLHVILFQELCQVKNSNSSKGVWIYQEYDETTFEPIDTGIVFNASIAEARKIAFDLVSHITDQAWYDPFATDGMFAVIPNLSEDMEDI